ncbi:MAG: response regulator [Sedimenticola sp.]
MSKTLTKIMLVDDEPDIREVARMSLEMVGGLQVETCENGVEALSRVHDIAPDLILLDVMMPEMTGPETLAQMQAAGYVDSTPVVFMTAKVQPNEVAEYKGLGAADVIAKPFDPMTLAEQVKSIWDTCEP